MDVTPATSARCASYVPDPASVADVPTHWRCWCGKRLTGPPHQHRHVGTLASPVGVEFVEHQEVQVLGGGDERSLLRPGEDQLEHDIIRQEDVRRLRDDLLLPFV
jgi:hypothetical protein